MNDIVCHDPPLPVRLPGLFPSGEVSARPTLQASDVHIWRLDLTASRAPIARLWQLLDQDERTRAAHFHFDSDRQRFVVAHGLVRCVLGWYLAAPPQGVHFAYGTRGKPALSAESAADLCFNLSHTADVGLVGLARGQEIGIDIEVVRAGIAQESIAEQFFSPEEVAELRALSVVEQDEAFFACWTRKEAYVKARGDGLALALDAFQVSLAPDHLPRLVRGYGSALETQRWALFDLGLRPTYCAAVVIEGAGHALRWYTAEDAAEQLPFPTIQGNR